MRGGHCRLYVTRAGARRRTGCAHRLVLLWRSALRDGDGRWPFRGETSGVIFDAILNRDTDRAGARESRTALKLEEIINKALEKDRICAISTPRKSAPTARLKRDTDSGKSVVGEDEIPARRGKPVTWIAGAALVAVVAVLAGFFLFRRPAKLTDKDSIVLADFTNTTGDSVFDGTLRRGLSVELEQSPFLSVVPDETMQQTLHFMGKAPDVRLCTPAIAREICQRTSSAVELEGSIALVGTKYDVTLRAINCATQEPLASAERQAGGKDQVLSVLGSMASEIREKLGESPLTVKKYNTSLIQATTSSLEALQAYNLGWKAMVGDQDNSGVRVGLGVSEVRAAFVTTFSTPLSAGTATSR